MCLFTKLNFIQLLLLSLLQRAKAVKSKYANEKHKTNLYTIRTYGIGLLWYESIFKVFLNLLYVNQQFCQKARSNFLPISDWFTFGSTINWYSV